MHETQYQYTTAVGEQYGNLPATGGPDLGLLAIAITAILMGVAFGAIARRYRRR